MAKAKDDGYMKSDILVKIYNELGFKRNKTFVDELNMLYRIGAKVPLSYSVFSLHINGKRPISAGWSMAYLAFYKSITDKVFEE